MPESKQSILLLHNLLSKRYCSWRLCVCVCMCVCAFECTLLRLRRYFCQFSCFLLKLCEVVGSLFCVLAALCFQFVLFCVFFFLSFMLFFQAVSPQLPHADSSDIHFSFYLPFLSPFSPPILRGLEFLSGFCTLTSLYCFSSFSFKAQNLTFPTFPPFLISNN